MTSTIPPPPVAPDPSTIYRHRVSILRSLVDAWRNRETIWSLAERQLRSRYKQALLGFAWALITPIALLVAITLVFQGVGNVDTQGAPYALFSYLALIPWTFFSTSLNNGSQSIISNLGLIQKINVPREVFPLSATVMAAIDSVLSVLAITALFAIEGYAPRGTSVWVPLLLLILVVFTAGTSVLMSVLTVYFRDLRNAMPLIVQLGLFATPVAYGLEVIPESIRPWYCLYPLAPVIDGLRRTVLFGQQPQWGYVGIGAIGAVLTLLVGYWLFKKMEVRIADVG